jgi:hypothetical protein
MIRYALQSLTSDFAEISIEGQAVPRVGEYVELTLGRQRVVDVCHVVEGHSARTIVTVVPSARE